MFLRALIVALALGACATPPANEQAAWTTLFNGENLDGWTAHYANAPLDTRPASALFTVENGTIHVYAADAAGAPQAQAYILSDAAYGDYVLQLEYRWGEKKYPPRLDLVRDAGLLYHVYDAPEQAWPRSVEFQIQEGDTGDVWAISTRVTSTIDPSSQLYAAPAEGGAPTTLGAYGSFERIRHAATDAEIEGWNKIELIVRGDSAVYLVNGVVNMRVSDLKAWDQAAANWIRLDRGRIALQAEFAELYYRNIRIRPLTDADLR